MNDSARPAPIVILTYPHAGTELLTQLLSASPSLTCTSATGLLPVCHDALNTWRQAEGRSGPPSALAAKSVRTLAATIIAVIQAREGKPRWCEVAYADPEIAQAFLRIFPDTTFLCLFRSMNQVLTEAIHAHPWGLGGTPLWAHAAAHPGNNAAAIAAYWTARTQALLEFESDHPGSCLRVRHEDLAADPQGQATVIFATLGLNDSQPAIRHEPLALAPPTAHGTDAAAGHPTLPDNLIPPPLLARAGELHAALGYEVPAALRS